MSSPSSAGRLRSLLLDRSRVRKLTNLEMSGGIRERQLSFRYNDVRCVRCHRFGLKFLIVPEEQKIITCETFFKLHTSTLTIIMLGFFSSVNSPMLSFLLCRRDVYHGYEIIHQYHQHAAECYWLNILLRLVLNSLAAEGVTKQVTRKNIMHTRSSLYVRCPQLSSYYRDTCYESKLFSSSMGKVNDI